MENRPGGNPLVSVLVITYLHEDYIARCIQGIIMQETDFSFELIIGTDCSPDRTDEIVREFHSNYPEIIRPVYRERNLGALANSTNSLKKARGKYISTCDGDDEWTDRLKLQKQVSMLEENPDIVLVYTDIDQYYVNSGKRVTRFQDKAERNGHHRDADGWFEAILLRKTAIPTATICTRTDCLMAARQDVHDILDTSPMGDTPTLLALTRYGNFAYLPESTASMNSDIYEPLRFAFLNYLN